MASIASSSSPTTANAAVAVRAAARAASAASARAVRAGRTPSPDGDKEQLGNVQPWEEKPVWQPAGPCRALPQPPQSVAAGLNSRRGSASSSLPASRPGSRPGSRPSSAGRRLAPAPAVVGTSSKALQEELRGPPLGPIPVSLATPMEKRVAETLGIGSDRLIPRLPLDVEACELGGRCCWRWLARMALEHVGGQYQSCGHGLPELVAALRSRFEASSEAQEAAETWKLQATRSAEELNTLRQMNSRYEAELVKYHSVHDELRHKEQECLELRATNVRLRKSEQSIEHELAKLRVDQRGLIETDLATARARADSAEVDIAKLHLTVQDWERRHHEVEQQLKKAEAEQTRLKKVIDGQGKSLRWRRLRRSGKPRK